MKKPVISNSAKKIYISWFMEHYSLENKSANSILYTLLSFDKKTSLDNLHIIESPSMFRPILIISSKGIGFPCCLLITEKACITQPEIICDYLLTNKEGLYLTFYYPERSSCAAYKKVLEVSPVFVKAEEISILELTFEIKLIADEEKKELRRQEILYKIDQVLDNREKSKFLKLVKELKSI